MLPGIVPDIAHLLFLFAHSGKNPAISVKILCKSSSAVQPTGSYQWMYFIMPYQDIWRLPLWRLTGLMASTASSRVISPAR